MRRTVAVGIHQADIITLVELARKHKTMAKKQQQHKKKGKNGLAIVCYIHYIKEQLHHVIW